MKRFEIKNADCREVMRGLAENSIDSIVTDPPYGLEFMSKGWDRGVPGVEFWTEALRVLKPGGYLLAFGGTRTFHRLTVAIEDSGFEIRDCLSWIYGSGFPKSHNISKAIDKAAGADREILAKIPDRWTGKSSVLNFSTDRPQSHVNVTGSPATPEAAKWEGWGTALKPAWEPIILARKPLRGTVAQNVLEFGTGGLNIDGSRIEGEPTPINRLEKWSGFGQEKRPEYSQEINTAGRWPANVIHDGSEEAIAGFPQTTSGQLKPHHFSRASVADCLNGSNQARHPRAEFGGDTGSAARFFYCAKASKADRDEGCEALPKKENKFGNQRNGEDFGNGSVNDKFTTQPSRNHHPTVKPSALMRHLVRLVTQPDGLILDPFSGSGSTGKAALLEGFRFLGAELDPEYAEIARARCLAAEIATVEPEPEPNAQLSIFEEG
jgi:site-specific DNA-methyltransferase (adenine-specific)